MLGEMIQRLLELVFHLCATGWLIFWLWLAMVYFRRVF